MTKPKNDAPKYKLWTGWPFKVLSAVSFAWLMAFLSGIAPSLQVAICNVSGKGCSPSEHPFWIERPVFLQKFTPVRCNSGQRTCEIEGTIPAHSRFGDGRWLYLEAGQSANVQPCEKDVAGKPHYRILVSGIESMGCAGSGYGEAGAEPILVHAVKNGLYGVQVETMRQGVTNADCEDQDREDPSNFPQTTYCVVVSYGP